MINIYFSDTEAVEACICRLNVMMMMMCGEIGDFAVKCALYC